MIGHEAAAAHLGVTKTKDAIFKTFHWPKCFSDVEDFVKTCDTNVKGWNEKMSQELAILHMEDAKQKQKLWYDRRTVKRQFQLGELVLVIAPSRPNKLSVQWVGPGEIVQQLSETNYVVKFPEKDKTHVYHVNMLKPYHQREENINLLCIIL
ncbi:retrovirus-related Pol polyprotein from transposon 412 [Trichonephila clavipes]|nr:retrovirus-related Pol polyprotein from transposon 412 [Trichonephila clavipes]